MEFQSGAQVDTRPEGAKLKDIHFNEVVVSAAPVLWEEKPESAWRKFPDQEQDGSGSCVAQTMRKLLGINMQMRNGKYLDFSASHVYKRRSNRPYSGMMGIEAFDIATQGVTLEALAPSENLSDAQMDAANIEKYEEDIGKILALGNHVGLVAGDIETVASVIQQTKKGVMVWFYFTASEWSKLMPNVENPTLGVNDAASLRHSVAAVDFFLVNGVKCVLIEDSAHFGGLTRRLVTEDFFKRRNWFARYGLQFKFDVAPITPYPHYVFSQPLKFISLDAQGNPVDAALNQLQTSDVMALQMILKFEGLFPTNVDATGYYGALTAKAVLAWQKKHSVAPLAELDLLQGRNVGSKTIAALNFIYGQ